jgi:nitric oxide reductase subunit C
MEVYRAQYCGACHELAVAGTAGVFGPAHDGLGTLAEQRITDPGYGGAATTVSEYIRESIVQPDAYLVAGYSASSHPMPAYEFLTEDEIEALVALLAAQK